MSCKLGMTTVKEKCLAWKLYVQWLRFVRSVVLYSTYKASKPPVDPIQLPTVRNRSGILNTSRLKSLLPYGRPENAQTLLHYQQESSKATSENALETIDVFLSRVEGKPSCKAPYS